MDTALVTGALYSLLVSSLVSPTQAQDIDHQEVDFTLFCNQFPSDAICQHPSTLAQQQENQQRENHVTQQVRVFEQPDQLIRLRLEVSGSRDEWIRIETRTLNNGETSLSAYHTKRVRQALLSGVASGLLSVGLQGLADEAIDGYDGPVPSPGINFYRWADHQSRHIAFVPDGCSGDISLLSNNPLPSCAIVGIDSITLPAGTNIGSGTFILEYQEEDLIRAITFRVSEEDF